MVGDVSEKRETKNNVIFKKKRKFARCFDVARANDNRLCS